MVAEDEMAALFAAEIEIVLEHSVDDIFVSNDAADDFPARPGDDRIKSGIAHDRAHKRFVSEFSLRQHLEGSNRHDVIPIQELARFIAKENSVSIAIVRNANIGAVFPNFLAHQIGMHGTAIFVDVFAVRLIAVNDHVGAEFTQDARGGLISSTVRAIDNDAHPLKGHPSGKRCFGMLDVSAERVVNTDGFADFVGSGADIFDFTTENEVLNFVFDFVIELITVRPEEFNAVVVVRVVRGSNNDSGIGAKASRYVRNPR